MSSVPNESEILRELIALLNPEPVERERNATAPQSAVQCEKLRAYVEARLPAGFDVERTTWRLTLAAAYAEAPETTPGRRPLKAAKYLLGVAGDDDFLADTGLAFDFFRRQESRSANATLANNKRIRQRAGAWAAGFGGEQHAYNSLSSSKPHGEKALHSVASHLWTAIQDICSDHDELMAHAVRLRLVASVPEDAPERDVSVAHDERNRPSPKKLRKRSVIVAVAGLALAVILATAAAINWAVPPREDISAPSNVAPGASEYWEAHWGPEREVFSLASGGSPYPSFNSITDNPNIGDERGFVGLRQDYGKSNAPNVWSDDVWGDVGDEFYMRVYVNNSGSDSNGIVPAGWLQGARLQVGLSRGVNESSVFGMLSADNATTVWDGATIRYPEGATVEFVPDFRKLENNAHGPEGLQLGPDVFETGGALLGYEEMDGVIRPGYQYGAYVVFRLLIVDAQAEVGTATVSGGWGPERDVVSVNGRTPQITINSMIDNPVHGDERNFFQARSLESGNDAYTDTLGVEGGGTYVGYVYFSNNSSGTDLDSTAEDVRLSVLMPAVVTGSAAAVATLSSSNSSPTQVWDSIVLAMPTPASVGAVRLVPGSATLNTLGSADGTELSDSVFSAEGALLGCDAVNGKIAPGPDCAGYVTFRFVVDVPDFSITAGGRPMGDGTPFSDAVRTAPGGVIQVQVGYRNTGTTQQNNVVFRVPALPEGVRYLEGSTQIANSATGGDWHSTIDGIVGSGYNVGSYAPAGTVLMRFSLMVSPDFGESHGWVEIRPLVNIETSSGYKSADLTLNLLQ